MEYLSVPVAWGPLRVPNCLSVFKAQCHGFHGCRVDVRDLPGKMAVIWRDVTFWLKVRDSGIIFHFVIWIYWLLFAKSALELSGLTIPDQALNIYSQKGEVLGQNAIFLHFLDFSFRNDIKSYGKISIFSKLKIVSFFPKFIHSPTPLYLY